MPPLGTKKINKMLILDYAEGKPSATFRAEIDVPLGSMRTYNTLKGLLEGRRSAENDAKIVRLLLDKLGAVSAAAKTAEKRRHKAARHFLAAAFDMEPPAP